MFVPLSFHFEMTIQDQHCFSLHSCIVCYFREQNFVTYILFQEKNKSIPSHKSMCMLILCIEDCSVNVFSHSRFMYTVLVAFLDPLTCQPCIFHSLQYSSHPGSLLCTNTLVKHPTSVVSCFETRRRLLTIGRHETRDKSTCQFVVVIARRFDLISQT